MIAPNLARVLAPGLRVLVRGRRLDELNTGLVVMNLAEWPWVRRSLGDCQPPPVLVWLPGDGAVPPGQEILSELRAQAGRFR
jgi:hypothetical protein